MSHPVDGNLWARRIAYCCVVLVSLVGLFDVVFYYYLFFPSEIISRSFNIAAEESFGTWVSTSLALLTGLTGLLKSKAVSARAGLQAALPWLAIAAFFLFISFDDAAKFHERVGSAFQYKIEDISGQELASWFPSWGWQLYVAPFFAAMGLWLCWFFFRELSTKQWRIAFVGLVFFGCAVGLDFVEGVIDREIYDVHFLRLAEEMLEMFGQTAFFFVLMSTLSDDVTLDIQITRPTSNR